MLINNCSNNKINDITVLIQSKKMVSLITKLIVLNAILHALRAFDQVKYKESLLRLTVIIKTARKT